MRNIAQAAPGHKRPFIIICGVALLMLSLAGCGGDAEPVDDDRVDATAEVPADQSPAAGTETRSTVGHVLHTTTFDAWLSTMQRLRDGKRVRPDEFERVFALPAFQAGFGDETNTDFNPTIFRNVATHVFAPGGQDGRTPKRKQAVENYTYLALRFAAAAALADSLEARGTFDDALARVRPYVRSSRYPEPLNVRLSAATPSVTWSPPDELILDAGLALASGPEHLTSVVSGALYRILEPSSRGEPYEASHGRDALVSALHKLHHVGVRSWLEQYPDLAFDDDHETYARPDPARDLTFVTAEMLVERIDQMLQTLLDPDEIAQLREVGGSVDDLLRLGRRYEPLGFAMSQTIISSVGETEFQRIARDGPGAWFEAFQAAALDDDTALHPMPAFSTDVFTRMLELLGHRSSKENR